MTVTVTTDAETDRMLSLRASSQVPLPPEICLFEPEDARRYSRWISVYEFHGLEDHPLVLLLRRRRTEEAMASAVSRASHLDRVMHYASWLGREQVRVVDLTHPTRDDPTGGS